MPELREVELRIAVAEGVLSRAEADALREEARRKKQSPLALLVEQGRLSEDSFQSILAEAMNDPVWRAAGTDASASTYTMQTEPPPPSEPPFPVAGWDRYTPVRFLGQGGMGVVFLAIDTRLRREVAIKFVRGNSADHVRRLISEARNQARVSHERICKVYEVDEVEGKVYIAMQYIAGKPLGRMADELTLEQKVTLVRGAAEGIHAAHTEGIIHRDIKPSNIMIERSDGGELRPYVMDFGLARSAQDVGETQTGAVVGTPRYMSPEQAQGATSKLDRRADVYSLGATLYHLVTGEPAVPGETVAEVIHNLIELEPRPLRAHDPGVPVDLEAIVLKCLEKDRSARYDSARALADDLGRFLNGEPVVARPADTWYRLRKRLAKHRRLVAAAAVTLAALVVAIGWAIHTRIVSAEREEFARQFTQAVESIDTIALKSALAPPHHIASVQSAIRGQMVEMEDKIALGGEAAAGPGHYALGRGYLALDDDARALEHLAVAWNGGFREPRVAYALAQVMGHLYQQNLLAAERIDDKDTREARKREIGWRYRDPALGFLSQTAGSGTIEPPKYVSARDATPPEYVAALVAYYEDRFDDALKCLDRIGDDLPWFYEAPQLRGDILFVRAQGSRHSGDRVRARRDLEAGRRAYADAARIGRSVPSVYQALGELEHAAMVMELYGQGDVTPPFERGTAAVAQALALMPAGYDALVLEARIQRSMAEHLANQGMNAEALLSKSLADASRAVELSRQRPEAQLEIARIYRQWGDYRAKRHEDPTEQYRQAVAASAVIAPEHRDATYHMNLGLIYSLWADYQDDSGIDSAEKRGQVLDAYTRALQLAEELHQKDQQRDLWINLGINSYKRASSPRATNPDEDLRHAVAALEHARSLDPAQFVSYLYEGRSYVMMARLARASGGEPGPQLDRAMDVYRRGLAVNPTSAYLHNGVGTALQLQASLAWDRGEDPEPVLAQAEAAFRKAIAEAPSQGFGYDNVGHTFVLRASFQRARGEDPAVNVAVATAMLKRAIEQDRNDPRFHADLGMAYAILAAYDLEHGRDPGPSVDAAMAALRDALDRNPRYAQAQFYRGEALGIVARLHARQGHGQPDEFAEAERAFDQARTLAPWKPDDQLIVGRFYRAWAAFRDESGPEPGPTLASGLALADDLLHRRPGWPDALILSASLRLLQAEHAPGPQQREAAERAVKDLSSALTTNRALDKAWGGQLARARQLSAPR